MVAMELCFSTVHLSKWKMVFPKNVTRSVYLCLKCGYPKAADSAARAKTMRLNKENLVGTKLFRLAPAERFEKRPYEGEVVS